MKTCVLVTAGGRNIGLTIARRFAQAGKNVVITGRKAETVEPVAQQIAEEFGVECFALALNQIQTETVDAMFAELDERGYVVESLVCNAANPGIGQPIIGTPLEDWRAVIDTNVIGTYALASNAAKRMIDNGIEGSITIIASNQAHRGIPKRSAYSASKGALSAMTKVFAVELASKGIRTNCVMPGRVRTDVFDHFSEEQTAAVLRNIPTGALVEQDEVAEAAFYLASPAARSITGIDFVIDGGCEVQMFSNQN